MRHTASTVTEMGTSVPCAPALFADRPCIQPQKMAGKQARNRLALPGPLSLSVGGPGRSRVRSAAWE